LWNVPLHPLAQQFASVAGEYERGRPEYPPAVVGALTAELGVPAGAPVLDLGAGTGKLSRALLAGGYDVVAVEPLAAMRDQLAERLGPNRVLDGTAEQIPLDDVSVAAVTVADAFHWFDPPAALAEIRRVLTPGGGLAVLTTMPDWSGLSWAHELGTLMMEELKANRLGTHHPGFDGPPWQEAVHAADGFGEPREIRITVALPSSAERIADHMASTSWIAALPDDRRREVKVRVGELLAGGEVPAEIPFHYSVGLATKTG
jgi:ubiquinone/menaquinone biosynthesis C-methylase UbiE